MLALLLPAGLAAPAAVLAADPEIISSVDFDDGTNGTWTQSGSPTLTYVDDGAGGQALSILRAQDYEGIQSPAGLLEHDVVYTLLDARPAARGHGRHDRRPVRRQAAFNWVGNTTINGSGWTTISGTYTLPAGTDPAATQVYVGSAQQAAPYTILVDDILITAPAAPPPTVTVLSTDFESGLDGWVPRGDAQGDPTVTLTTDESHSPTHAALVSDRTSQGDGIGHDVTGIMNPGTTYVITAWVKFAAGNPTDTLWLSMRRTNGGSDSFDTHRPVHGRLRLRPSSRSARPTRWGRPTRRSSTSRAATRTGRRVSFLVDDITIESQAPPVVEDLTPVKDTVDFPLGSAIDSRETTGASSELLLRHFDQVTPENHMKPEAWYDDARTFRIHPEAQAIMDFAQDERDARLRPHARLAQPDPGLVLPARRRHAADDERRRPGPPADPAARPHLRRGRDAERHVRAVRQRHQPARRLRRRQRGRLRRHDRGRRPAAQPLVQRPRRVATSTTPSRSRTRPSTTTYAADGADHPVTLAINDYNTEQSGKRQRMHDLVERLLDRGVPVDAVGHQFHLSLSTPVGTLEEAITAFEDLPVTQVVSEMDVTTGTPVDEAKLIDQGYYYRDAFRIFRAHADDLFAVTLWGLHDGRSWRSAGAPLLFDANLKAKPAYFGAVDGELDARLRTAFVFQGSVPLDAGATDALAWQQLPLHRFGDDKVGFQLRWEADHLTAYVEVADATPEAADAATFVVDDATFVFRRDGTGDVSGVVDDEAGGWKAVVHLPLSGAAIGDQLSFDVVGHRRRRHGRLERRRRHRHADPRRARVVHRRRRGGDRAGHRRRDRRRVGRPPTPSRPTSRSRAAAERAPTSGPCGRTTRCTCSPTSPTRSSTTPGSDPWIEDSVEIYVDAGNVKNGSYRFDDTQIRINFNNVTSFGTGDEAFQANRLTSATKIVADGYVVEASISLLEAGGVGTFHGLDFQVNDATAGVRTSIRNWADPTGLGYQSTSRWGVGRLVAAQVPTSISYAGSPKVKIGKAASFGVVLSASEASCVGGLALSFSFDRDPVTGATGPTELGEATTNADGRAKLTVATTGWTAGTYELTVSYAGNDLGCVGSSTSTEITVAGKGGPNQ